MILGIVALALVAVFQTLVIVGVMQRLARIEGQLGVARAEVQPTPAPILRKISDDHPHHFVLVVDESCTICHDTVRILEERARLDRSLPARVSILTNSVNIASKVLDVIQDYELHRTLHPGWAPAGLVFTARGLRDTVPVGSPDALAHALDKITDEDAPSVPQH